MRRHFNFGAALTALALCCGVGTAFDPTPQPISPDGTRATIDLPTSQHMRNTGGIDRFGRPGQGDGLCVFTSIEHAGRWQNVQLLTGFQKWMTYKEGGGWPQKVDQMLSQYAREKGASVPPYIQHTGGDESFLELALKTDRIVCVTYDGRDDFYRNQIAHMVNLAHLDAKRAAIIDNNRPGVWVWMSRAEFLSRWRGNSGGWAVVLLADPPPPAPEGKDFLLSERKTLADGKDYIVSRPATRSEVEQKFAPYGGVAGSGTAQKVKACGCVCGDSCSCKPGECPGKCPVVFGQCQGGRCPVPSAPLYAPGGCPGGRCPVPVEPMASPAPELSSSPFGSPPSDRHEWRQFPDGAWGWRFKDEPAKVEAAGVENHGVDASKIHAHPRYSINGSPCTKGEAERILVGADGLKDDSNRWHLTAVGDAAFLERFKVDVAGLPVDTRGKLLVQAYSSDAWPVAAYKLPGGVSLRKPSPGRTASEVGSVPVASYTAASLADLLSLPDGPTPKPKPTPAPQPTPGPEPTPGPVPTPTPKPNQLPWLIAAALALVLIFRK